LRERQRAAFRRLPAKKEDMKMKMWKVLTLAIALVVVGAPLVAGFTTWLSPVAHRGVFALASPVAGAVVLVLYFRWRASFVRQILADDDRDDELLRAA
jgi:hypothetical protein